MDASGKRNFGNPAADEKSPAELGGLKPKPRFLDALRSKLRLLHYAGRTEDACVDWTRRFIRFHQQRHPAVMGTTEVEARSALPRLV